MMPAARAFLLCSDEKALEVVFQILSELEVSFEHFQEPSLAVKRLANQRFDAILVDCDNEQNATLIFNKIRNSSCNQGSMTIAIADGKAGVPTAFRLGANLVMAKPVSLEQARSTLRNAFAMQRKEAQEGKALAVAAPHGSTIAGAHSPEKILEQKPVEVPAASPTPPSRPPQPIPASLVQAKSQSPPTTTRPSPRAQAAEGAVSRAPASTRITSSPAAPAPPASILRIPEEEIRVAPHRLTRATTPAPSFATLEKSRRKISPSLLVAFALLLVVAGLYALWTMQPGFRNAVLGQYEKLHPRPVESDTRPVVAAAVKPASAQPPAAQVPATSSAPPSNSAALNVSSPANPGSTPIADGFASPPAAPAQGFVAEHSANNSAATPGPPSTSPTASKADKDDLPVVVPEEEADAHVQHRVRPAYPDQARRQGIKGAVVMEATVNQHGTVGSVRILWGNRQLVTAAVVALKQWRYDLYYRDGQAVDFQTRVKIHFPPSPQKPR